MRIKKECSLLLKVNVLLIFNKLPFKEEERTQKTITFICNQLTYIIHSGFISGYQNRYGDNLKPPTNVYHRMTA